MSHPRPRTAAMPGGVDGVVIRCTVSGDRILAAVERAAVEQRAREARQIARRREQPRVPATPPMRRAVGSCTVPRSIACPGSPHGQPSGVHRSVGAIRGMQRRRRHEHACRPCPAARTRARACTIERLAGHLPDDVAEQEEVDVAVDEPRVRRRRRHLLHRPGDGLVVAVELDLEFEVRPQPGRVRQQVADGDVALAVALEPGHVGRDAIGRGAGAPAPPTASPPSSSPPPS